MTNVIFWIFAVWFMFINRHEIKGWFKDRAEAREFRRWIEEYERSGR